jgi:hypothetical protein
LTIHASAPSFAEVALPPKGGLLAIDKQMTLLTHEYRDNFCEAGRRVLPLAGVGSVVVRGAASGFTGGL